MHEKGHAKRSYIPCAQESAGIGCICTDATWAGVEHLVQGPLCQAALYCAQGIVCIGCCTTTTGGCWPSISTMREQTCHASRRLEVAGGGLIARDHHCS